MVTKHYAIHDSENYRFIIRPLKSNGSMPIAEAIRIIKKRTNFTWRALAEFCGIEKQSEVFKLAYVHNGPMGRHPLKDFLVIDDANNCAFLYDKEHKPAGVIPPHIGPTLFNGETTVTVTERVPTKVVSRVRVKDNLDRVLTLSLTPTNGYLLGVQARSLAIPGMTYSVSGTCKSLNKLLRSIFFVGTKAGSASVVVKIDDGAGDVASVASTTVSITVKAATALSVPDIVLPTSPRVETGKYMGFEPIKVVDTDGKLMEFRMSVYGCYVAGFKSFMNALTPGKVKNIYGRPEDINADIAGLQVYPYNTNAQIGVELICGPTRIRKYLVLEVSGDPCPAPQVYDNGNVIFDLNKQFDNEKTTGTVSEKTQITGDTSSQTVTETSTTDPTTGNTTTDPTTGGTTGGNTGNTTPTQTEKMFTIDVTDTEVTAGQNFTPSVSVDATGFASNAVFDLQIEGSDCYVWLTSQGEGTNSALQLSGTLDTLRTQLADLKATPTDADGGSLSFHLVTSDTSVITEDAVLHFTIAA